MLVPLVSLQKKKNIRYEWDYNFQFEPSATLMAENLVYMELNYWMVAKFG